MRESTQRLWYLIGVLLVGSTVSPIFAAPATLTLTGPGNNGVLANIYVGPYVATINGVSTQVICDDFYDATYLNESWTANVSSVSNLSNPKFGGAAQTQYDEVAYLSQQLLNPSVTCPKTANCAGDIQFAIWQVFDSTGSGQPFSYLSGNDLSNAQYWLNQAQSQHYTSGEFSNFLVYTPTGAAPTCNGGPCASAPPQEFITDPPPVRTPEPPELALLGVDLGGVGALVLFFRRRGRQAVS